MGPPLSPDLISSWLKTLGMSTPITTLMSSAVISSSFNPFKWLTCCNPKFELHYWDDECTLSFKYFVVGNAGNSQINFMDNDTASLILNTAHLKFWFCFHVAWVLLESLLLSSLLLTVILGLAWCSSSGAFWKASCRVVWCFFEQSCWKQMFGNLNSWEISSSPLPNLINLLGPKVCTYCIWRICVDCHIECIYYCSSILCQLFFFSVSIFLQFMLYWKICFFSCQYSVLKPIFKFHKCLFFSK